MGSICGTQLLYLSNSSNQSLLFYSQKPFPKEKIQNPPTTYLKYKQIQNNMSTTPKLPLDAINGYEKQLNSILNGKFCDQSILLGLINVAQSKFYALITEDFQAYYEKLEALDKDREEDSESPLVEFLTITYFEALWTKFHYPIIKFFRFQQASIYNESVQNLKDNIKNEKEVSLKLKTVEVRKLNENFIKFSGEVYKFYFNLLKYFITEYENQLLPKKLFEKFDLSVSETARESTNANVQANLVYLTHRCVLYMGDLSRHRSFIDVSYVQPSISANNFWRFKSIMQSQNPEKKAALLLPHFKRALENYRLCILLLPALGEPYNHIGMIYNQVDDKYHACYWFLRSCSTRIQNFDIGQKNFKSVMSKVFFISQMTKQWESTISKVSCDSLNTMFMVILGYYYLPSVYRWPSDGKNITKSISYHDVETKFWKSFDPKFLTEVLSKSSSCEMGSENIILSQLIMLMSLTEVNPATASLFSQFRFRYIVKILKFLLSIYPQDESTIENSNLRANIFVIYRFIYAWLRENVKTMKYFNKEGGHFAIFDIWNTLLEELKVSTPMKDINKLYRNDAKPQRFYFFKEDVNFKDFAPIKFQFRDFRDEHLFHSRDINILMGDYSRYTQNGLPSFISSTLVDDSMDDEEKKRMITLELFKYENNLRVKSILLLSKKLIDIGRSGIEWNKDDCVFIIPPSMSSQLRDYKRSGISRSVNSKTQSLGNISTNNSQNANTVVNTRASGLGTALKGGKDSKRHDSGQGKSTSPTATKVNLASKITIASKANKGVSIEKKISKENDIIAKNNKNELISNSNNGISIAEPVSKHEVSIDEETVKPDKHAETVELVEPDIKPIVQQDIKPVQISPKKSPTQTKKSNVLDKPEKKVIILDREDKHQTSNEEPLQESKKSEIPETLQEIESFILGHTSTLHNATVGGLVDSPDTDTQRQVGLQYMVDSLFLENRDLSQLPDGTDSFMKIPSVFPQDPRQLHTQDHYSQNPQPTLFQNNMPTHTAFTQQGLSQNEFNPHFTPHQYPQPQNFQPTYQSQGQMLQAPPQGMPSGQFYPNFMGVQQQPHPPQNSSQAPPSGGMFGNSQPANNYGNGHIGPTQSLYLQQQANLSFNRAQQSTMNMGTPQTQHAPMHNNNFQNVLQPGQFPPFMQQQPYYTGPR